MREIEDILWFRGDISPFLAHLTRDIEIEGGLTAFRALEKIIQTRTLKCGPTLVSDARYGMYTADMDDDAKSALFSAICFTETPLSEVHCLLEIAYRKVHLAPYGLVFLKDRLASKGVSPVLYINNEKGDKDKLFQALCSLAYAKRDAARKLLPLIAVFGQKIKSPSTQDHQLGMVDFRWEREWRYPFTEGPLDLIEDDIFIGLCPDRDIEHFEALLPSVGFIDPMMNMKWYATKLVKARQRLDIKFSVV